MTPLEVAHQELSQKVKEATGNNDGIPAARYNFGENKPWCAAFVAYCFAKAGQPLPGARHRLASVAYLEEKLKENRAEIPQPQPGAIVTFKSRGQSDAGPGRHVGIVDHVGPDTFTTIEGNTSNRVAQRTYRTNDPTIAGFFYWPLRRHQRVTL